MSIGLTLDDYKELPNLRLIISDGNRKIIRKKQILKKLNIPFYNVSRYINGKRSLPVRYLYECPNLLTKIMKENPVFITNGGVKVTLPNKINTDIAYLTGFICGDGSLVLTKKRDYRVTIHNKEKSLLKTVLELVQKNFNYHTVIREGHRCNFVKIESVVVFSFLNKVMEIEIGRKQNIIIPKRIKSSRELIRSFIAGFFDAEGSVGLKKNKVTCQIMFSQKQKNILEEIREELLIDRIRMKLFKSNHWVLYGNKDSLEPFFKKIRFLHPKKRLKLETAIKNRIELSSN